jgi:glycosyltransferase involved in cell wall biosynthesis
VKILFVGRLVDFKDPVTFIKAAQLLAYHQFILAGDGELMKECKSLAEGFGNISLLGWVKHEDVNALIDEADVFCQLSPYENIWASVLISAMKYKKAVVCTDAGTTKSFLKNYIHALLIHPRDHVALAKAITRLAADDKLRLGLGESAFALVESTLSLEKIAGEIHRMIANTVNIFEREKEGRLT